jgi:hypothetical protein
MSHQPTSPQPKLSGFLDSAYQRQAHGGKRCLFGFPTGELLFESAPPITNAVKGIDLNE